MVIQIHEHLCVKNYAECIVYIICPFPPSWKMGIFISIVHMTKIILAKLELDFKPKSCLFSYYLYDVVLSFTMSYCLLCPHPNSTFLIPDISHLLPTKGAKANQVRMVYCVYVVPIILGHIIMVSQCVSVGCIWVSVCS